jgi:hypothetical protein
VNGSHSSAKPWHVLCAVFVLLFCCCCFHIETLPHKLCSALRAQQILGLMKSRLLLLLLLLL